MALLTLEHRAGLVSCSVFTQTVVLLKKGLASERFALLIFNVISFIKELASGWLQ